MADDYVPRPWTLVKIEERVSDVPFIRAANGRVVCEAIGNIWTWQDFIAPMIIAGVNGSTDSNAGEPK